MNKAILISIRPEHLVNILNGKKTLELRKTVPKDYKGWVYIYCTRGKDILEYSFLGYRTLRESSFYNNGIGMALNGKVVARFWFDGYDYYDDIIYVENEYIWCNGITLSVETIGSYYLSKLKLSYEQMFDYGKGKDLYAWHIKQLEIFDEPLSLSDFIVGLNYLGDIIPPTYKKLKKAPQSWQYVYTKEIENDK